MILRLFASIVLLAGMAFSQTLTPGKPVQSGSTILTPLESGNRSVFLLTSVNPGATGFAVHFTVKDSPRVAFATRPGTSVQDLAVVVIESPLAEILNVSVQSFAAVASDRFSTLDWQTNERD